MTLNPQLESSLRQGFKYFNHYMLFLWRLGLGKWLNLWPHGLGRYMVITHIGRKSGRRRRTPVNYTLVDEEVYCIAGFGGVTDWYRNLLANPQVEVWLPAGWWAGIAEEVTDDAVRLPILRQVLIDSGFAARAAGLDPAAMPDEELKAVTGSYRLIHIRRTTPLTGANGPGDLAWVWPLATFVLLPLALLRRR